MSNVVTSSSAVPPVTASPKNASAKNTETTKKPTKPRIHPPVGDMVLVAIKTLAEKKGSSLQAIKKYIAAHYKIDVDKQSTFIKKYLKSAVVKETIVQTKGSGATGSFKLSAKAEGKKITKKPTDKKPAGEKKAKKSVAAKKPSSKSAKKPTKLKADKPAKAAEPVKATKSSKLKKTAVSKTAKPKAKKTVAPKIAKPKAIPK